jgi:ankyrin repeat protein
MVVLLLERGPDVNKSGAPRATPLAWAEKKGYANIEAELRQARAATLRTTFVKEV